MFRCLLTAMVLVWPSFGSAETIFPGYEWRAIDEGIYLHTQEDPFAGPVDGNSIVIINEDDVFVIDTHINPAVARAVVAKIKSITDNPVSTIINTHWHDDHLNGNATFQTAYPNAEIIAHPFSAEKLKAEWRNLEESRMAAYESLTVERILEAAEAAAADDPMRAMNLRLYAGYVEALKPELTNLEYVYPSKFVSDQLVFERGAREIEIQWVGNGNTEGDLIVFLPAEKILITGDMLVAPIPYAFDSPMQEWASTLTQLKKFSAQTIVPGHGKPQGSTQYLDQVVGLFTAMMSQVDEAAKNGVTYKELADAVDLDEYRELFTGGSFDAEFAWKNYFFDPGLKSAWVSLGYDLPAEE